MAITYQAGRRIQGTSTAVTNWVEASGTNGTGAGQYDSSNTSGDNSFNYDTANSEIDFDVVRTSQTPNCMMKDITSSTNGLGTALSTTNWRMRFKIYWDNWEDRGDITLWLGLCSFSRSEAINGSNSNDVRKPTGGDLIGLQFVNANLSNNCWNNLKFYYGENEDDTTRFGGDSVNHAVDLEVANTILASSNYNCNKPTDDTYYWCEIIRDGSTVTFNCSKTAYGLSDVCGASNSDAGKTTSGTATTTFGTTRPLKYFYVGKTGGTGSTAHIQGTISDLQIESTGSSSIDRGQLTNAQVGSRFEETDTRKMYHYNPQTATVDDDLTTDKGWVSDTSDWTYNATGDYIDFATVRRRLASQTIYIDMQDADYLGSGNNLSDTKWVARFKVRSGAASSTGNVLLYLGFSNNLGDSGATQQSACLQLNFSPTESNMVCAVSRNNFETTGSPQRVNSNVYTSNNLPFSTDFYIQMVRDGDTFTMKAYSDEYVTPAGSTATSTVTGISALRYIKGFIDSEQAQTYYSTGSRLYDMKIYNGVTTVPTGNAWSEEGT